VVGRSPLDGALDGAGAEAPNDRLRHDVDAEIVVAADEGEAAVVRRQDGPVGRRDGAAELSDRRPGPRRPNACQGEERPASDSRGREPARVRQELPSTDRELAHDAPTTAGG